MLRIIVAGLVLASAGALHTGDSPSERLEKLQPVLEKLRGLDPKAFGALSGMISKAEGGTPPSSFLQYLRDDPQEVQEKLEKLAPLMEKLKGLDPKAFGALTSVVGKVSKTGASLLQEDPSKDEDVKAAQTIEALQPVLQKLRGLDPKAFGVLSSMMSKVTKQQ
eukprot:NODE_3617_length_763_cov_430.005650.p2 GENE.NODE_3617_length_763_cov_430.005650~~NODE_3617_length_763_cov_430.005650.p2  ORF type:complete len:164 (-),score=79.60 NODE_3617_length_763_cov_430.005650:167-658(-)